MYRVSLKIQLALHIIFSFFFFSVIVIAFLLCLKRDQTWNCRDVYSIFFLLLWNFYFFGEQSKYYRCKRLICLLFDNATPWFINIFLKKKQFFSLVHFTWGYCYHSQYIFVVTVLLLLLFANELNMIILCEAKLAKSNNLHSKLTTRRKEMSLKRMLHVVQSVEYFK